MAGIQRLYASRDNYSQTSLQNHVIQSHSLYNSTHVGNCFSGLCTKCTSYNNNLVITACCSGLNGVVVRRFDCSQNSIYTLVELQRFNLSTYMVTYIHVSWCGGKNWVDQRVPQAYIHDVALLL